MTTDEFIDLTSKHIDYYFPKGKTNMRGEAIVLLAMICNDLLNAGLLTSTINTPKEVDKQLDEILAEHEYKVTGTPKHWNKTPERKALDNELKAKLKQLLTQQKQAARKEGLQEYRKLILAWAENFHPELLAELKQTPPTPDLGASEKPQSGNKPDIKQVDNRNLRSAR